MIFEWDQAKSDRTRQERGFGFEDAVAIFAGPVIEWQDTRKDWGEVRIVSVGCVDGRILAVVHTQRGGARRIISARAARAREKEQWLSFASP